MDEIVRFLARFHGDDKDVQELLGISVGRIIRRISDGGAEWQSSVSADDTSHVADWLKASVTSSAGWLRRTDGEGRPLKLMKCGDMARLVHEADKAMSKAIQRDNESSQNTEGEQVVAELKSGFRMVRLTDVAALKRESSAMQHCIGNGAYDERVRSESYSYLSLRDRHGRSHATIEVMNGSVQQLQGKQNKPPRADYVDVIVTYLQEHSLDFQKVSRQIGKFTDAIGRTHDVHDIPDGVTFDGDVDFSGFEIARIAENMTVRGSLTLTSSVLTEIPETLVVTGSLYLQNSGVRYLPRRLRVGGNLSLAQTSVKHLPDGFELDGTLEVTGSSLTSLPESITVGGSVYLRGYRFGLPTRLRVGKSLFMQGVAVTRLPEELDVGENLDLRWTHVEELPDDLRLSGTLYLNDSRIRNLPRGLSVGGNLELAGTKVTGLPRDMAVGGDIVLDRSSITRLPDGLSVGGTLSLADTGLADLPVGLRVGKTLKLSGSKVAMLSDDLVVGREVDIRNTGVSQIPLGVADNVLVHSGFGRMTAAEYRVVSEDVKRPKIRRSA